MGSFRFNGIDGIEASFEQLARLSDNDKLRIIRPAAERLKDLQSEAIGTVFNKITGRLANSLVIEEKSGPKLVVLPKGKHSDKTGKRFKKGKDGKRRSSGRYDGSNAELLYILEYGSPRIPASHVIETTNEKAEDEIFQIEAEAWSDYLSSLGL